MVPYCLRALQLVVVYNTRYRLKYARYVKGAVIMKISVATVIGVALAIFLVFYYVPDRYSRYDCLHGVYMIHYSLEYSSVPVIDCLQLAHSKVSLPSFLTVSIR